MIGLSLYSIRFSTKSAESCDKPHSWKSAEGIMKFEQLNFHGDPNIGLYGIATDSYAVIGIRAGKVIKKLEKVLSVGTYPFNLLRMELIKFFIAGNSKNIVSTYILQEDDIKDLKAIAEKLKLELTILETEKAVGNLILLNDHGIVVSPLIKRQKTVLEKHLGLPCSVATIAGFNILGTLGIVTNKGGLVHPDIKESEIKILEKTLQINVDIGTVNFGSPYPGSAIIANSHGFVASQNSSGHECGKIAEALAFVK